MEPLRRVVEIVEGMRQIGLLRDNDAKAAFDSDDSIQALVRIRQVLEGIANHPSLIASDPDATEVDSENEVETVVDGSVGGDGEGSEQEA